MADEITRFPNRKKPDVPHPLFDGKAAPPDQNRYLDDFTDREPDDFGDPDREAKPLPVSSYKIVDSEPEYFPARSASTHLPPSLGVSENEKLRIASEIDRIAALNLPSEAGILPGQRIRTPAKPPTSRPTLAEISRQVILWFVKKPTRIYVAGAAAFGVLIGIVCAFALWHWDNPEGRYDLGPVTSSAAGLKGRLFVEWDRRQLAYRLALEPSDTDQIDAFSMAVAHSPRPLSVEIHLQDSKGFVLCGKQILLRFDPGAAPLPPASTLDRPSGLTEADALVSSQSTRALEVARLEAEEPERELGKDIFQNQIGTDGKIVAINAQGTMPCTAKAYERAESWSFTPDFPSLAEQNELLKRPLVERAEEERRTAEASAAARNKSAAKSAAKLLAFSIEGDDTIVDFDASRGVIETTGRKTFYIDKNSGATADAKWQEYPVGIHYRCDRSSSCVLMHTGLGALRARMKR